MKCRCGHVTNSSSSSFILAFKDEKDLAVFEENCEWSDYNEFYKLIESISSDFLVFDNNTNEEMPIRPLIKKIEHIWWNENTSFKLGKLYTEDYKIKPYGSVSIPINTFGNNSINLEEINFEKICEEDKYSIRILSNQDNRDKDAALDFLYHCYSFDFKYKVLDEKFKNCYPGDDVWKQKQEYEKSDEINLFIKEYLKNNKEYQEKKKQIEEAKIIVKGMIWDTNGGLLEWAIRNGFIEDNFRRNCVICYNVG